MSAWRGCDQLGDLDFLYATGRGLTGDLPDDEGAEERIAQDEKRRYPLRVPWLGQHVLDERYPGHCGAVVDLECRGGLRGSPLSVETAGL